jgi:hypothetical protein
MLLLQRLVRIQLPPRSVESASPAFQESGYDEEPNANESDGIPAPHHGANKLRTDRLALGEQTSNGRYHTAGDRQGYDEPVVRESLKKVHVPVATMAAALSTRSSNAAPGFKAPHGLLVQDIHGLPLILISFGRTQHLVMPGSR